MNKVSHALCASVQNSTWNAKHRPFWETCVSVTFITPTGSLTRPVFLLPAAEVAARPHPTCTVGQSSNLDTIRLHKRFCVLPDFMLAAALYLRQVLRLHGLHLPHLVPNLVLCKGLYRSGRGCEKNNLRRWPGPEMFLQKTACERLRCISWPGKSLRKCDLSGPDTENCLLRSCSKLWQAWRSAACCLIRTTQALWYYS